MKMFDSAASHAPSDLTIAEAVTAFRDGVLTSVELVLTCLDRSEEGKDLNVYVTLDGMSALQAAKAADQARRAGMPQKPLSGIPIVVKDNIHVAGMPCTAGSPAFEGFVPAEDAPTVRKLRDAG